MENENKKLVGDICYALEKYKDGCCGQYRFIMCKTIDRCKEIISYIYNKQTTTDNDIQNSKTYRIIEKLYDDGRIEYFPQYYNEEWKKMSRFKSDGWFPISENGDMVFNIGYDTFEKAKIQIVNHKNNIKPLGQNIISEETHCID